MGTVRRTWIVVFAFFALAGSAHAASDTRLLTKFQPVTRFDSAESFRPTTVESFIADSDLEPVGPGVGLNQRYCTPSAALGDLSCYVAHWTAHDAPEVVYGRVARLETRIVVQYWYFYYDNLYSYTHTPSNFIWQAHEGDWEVVNVVLRAADDAPLFAGYSEHCLGQRRAWSMVPRWHGTHPIVYVASGSHANYFSSGQPAIATSCLPPGTAALLQSHGLALPVDYADGDGGLSGPSSLGAAETEVRQIDGGPSWVAFPGFWGELQYLFTPFGLNVIGTSPRGPAFHEVWVDPLGTLATWPLG